LQAAALIDKIPAMVAVQSAACAPIWAAFHNKSLPVSESSTLAEGVKVLRPVRATALLNELNRERDQVLAFDDDQLMAARSDLARRGIDIEPTSALVWCALTKSDKKLPEPIVLVLTGSGLKYEGKQ
ncbi:MAG: pyridoxal-phosphate dependent enzyme, partial [Anaerolineaceae bacterium]